MSTRRAFLSAGGASAIALSLAACSRSQTKTAETLASGTPIAEPVLNDKQLAEIGKASHTAVHGFREACVFLRENPFHQKERASTPRYVTYHIRMVPRIPAPSGFFNGNTSFNGI